MRNQNYAVAAGTALVAFNIALMIAISYVPQIDPLFNLLWQYAIIGVLAFGAMLTAGNYLAERGIRNDNKAWAAGGTTLLMAGYGIFGAGIVSPLQTTTMLTVLGITAAVTALVTLITGLGVNYSNRDFSIARKYALYSFIGLIGAAAVGTFFTPVLIVAFILALTGFLLQLVYEVWHLQQESYSPMYHALGLYVAVTGVFVHILQLVMRWYLDD